MPSPYDYSSLIQAGQNLVPDVTSELARTSLMRAQASEAQAEAAAATQKVSRAQQFQHDITTYDGSPTSASRLIMKYPEFADHLKQGWDVQDNAKKQADLLNMGEIYSAASGGNWDLAKTLAHKRADAEKANGYSDPAYDETLRVMDSAADGDPTQRKVVLNMLGTSIAAVTGPEHFATVYGGLSGKDDKGFTLDAGATRYDSSGNVVAKSPYIKTADGGLLMANGTGGGDPASPGAAPTTAPGGPVVKRTHGYTPRARDGGDNPDHVVDNKIAALSSAVGVDPDTPMNPQQFAAFAQALPATEGTSNSLTGKNNNPGGIKDGQFAKAQPGYAGAWKGYAVFKDQSSGMAAMRKLLTNRFYTKGQQSIRDIIEGRPVGGTATGGAPSAVAPATDGAPSGYHWLTPPKGKEAPSGYRYAADGNSLEPIPGGPADPNGIKNAGPLKPDALRTATISYIKTGKMPAGMGGQALKNQILNFVPQIMDEHGLTPDDMPSIQQQFGADSAAFKQRIGQLSYMSQSVGKLNQHAQDLSSLIKAIPLQGKFAPLNWITQGAEGMVSNSTLAQLRGGLPLFESEVARVMTGNPNSGSGQLSDDARHEFDILHSSQDPASKIDAMNRIMKMVEESVKSTRDETVRLKGRIGGGVGVYAGDAPKSQAQPQDQGWITLPSGLKIRKIH